MEPTTDPKRTSLRRSGRLPWVAAALVVLAGAAYLGFRLLSHEEAPPAPPAPPPVAAAPEPQPPAAPAETPVDAEGARALLEGVSSDPLFRKWLEAKDLVRRAAIVIENVAEGTSPRKALPFLAPHRPFTTAQRGERAVIASEAFARYDAFADAIGSLDVSALASAYRRLHGALDAAYRALGFPAGALDRATVRALRRVEGAPAPKGEVEVVLAEGVWVFADGKLEALDDVQKHLVRMGPRNEAIVQGKARALREALALPEVASARR